MQKPVSEVQERDVIDDGHSDPVLVGSVWNQGRGLGVVIKGQHVDDGTEYFRRFLDPDTLVEVTGRHI